MPTITSISPQQKISQRYNIFVDEEFYCGVNEDQLVSQDLHKGKSVSQEELETIFFESEAGKLYYRALDYLSYRPRSEQEMRIYLSEKAYKYEIDDKDHSKIIERIIVKLRDLSYLDDMSFTRWWVEQRTNAHKPKGYRIIYAELRKKGVSETVIKQVWNAQEIDEGKLVQEAYEKVQHKYDVQDKKERQKLVNYLKRRGFLWEDIKSVLK